MCVYAHQSVLTFEHSIPQRFLEGTALQSLVNNKGSSKQNSEVVVINESPHVGHYPVFSFQMDVLGHSTDEYSNQYLYKKGFIQQV
jgi:hypothetical protein